MANPLGISTKRIIPSAKVALLRNPTPGAFYDIRAALPAHAYEEYFSWAIGQNALAGRIFTNRFPKSLSEWRGAFSAPNPVKLSDELHWAVIVLKPNAKLLCDFAARTVALDKSFLKEDELECQSILDSIEKDFGLSYWLIKRRISFLQQFNGLEAQKRYSQNIKDGDPNQNAIRYIAHFASNRVETTISPFNFKTTYNRELQALDVPDFLKTYLRYHILSEDPSTTSGVAGILRTECVGTIVDYYESLVSMSRLTSSGPPELRAATLTALCTLRDAGIEDLRLSRTIAHCGGPLAPSVHPSADDLEVDALFCEGNYPAGFSRGLAAINAGKNSGSIFVTTALCAASELEAIDIKSLPATISSLKTLIGGGNGTVDAAFNLARISWALQGSPISQILLAMLQIESMADPLPGKDGIVNTLLVGMGAIHPMQRLWARGSELPHPELGGIKPPLRGFGSDAENWHCAIAAMESKNFADALQRSKRLAESKHAFYRRFSSRAVPHCLLMLGQIDEAIESTANCFVGDPSTFELLPVTELVEAPMSASKARMTGSLSYAIICDMYADRMGHANHIRQFAYEDYLFAQHLTRPTELTVAASDPNISKLVYFLRQICAESVMDTSVAFESSVEVANERIGICHLLVGLDPKNSEQYQSEIRSIVQRMTIRKRLRQIEQSKIYVDVESVKNVARKDLKEGFLRYISFIANGLSKEDKAYFDSVRERRKEGDIDTLLSTTVPRNERAALLETIYLRLRDEFVSSTQHGLDGYLSVRIRHGTLAGQLRSPLDNEALLTQRDSKANIYKVNQTWLSRLEVRSPREQAAVTAAFSNFSAGIDALIEEMLRGWIQVKKSSSENGLIDFDLLPAEIGFLSAEITPDQTLDQFLDKTLDYFFKTRLEISLARIRGKIQEDAKPRIHNLLIALQTAIEAGAPSSDAATLRAAIGRASTNMRLVLDRIIEWFRLPAAEKDEPFSVEEAISICKAIRPDFRSALTVAPELEGFRIKGNLHSFVDIIYLAFDNIVKHAGIPRVVAHVDIQLDGNALVVVISNPIDSSVANDLNREKVRNILRAVKMQPFSTSVTKEGGTGFHKLQKILHHDFCPPNRKTDPSLAFGFSSNELFQLEIRIPILFQATELEGTHENTVS